MTRSKLILAPVNPEAVPPDAESLIRNLGKLGFIGRPFPLAGRTHHLPGEHFLDLVTFLGCSPVISLVPPVDTPGDPAAHADAFCHIGLWYAGEQAVFIGGRNTAPPRCPRCRERETSWQALITAWTSRPSRYRWHCPACSQDVHPFQLDWRQSAGFGRFFVEIWGIHPAEAVPGDLLLDTLERSTGEPWSYFYWQAS